MTKVPSLRLMLLCAAFMAPASLAEEECGDGYTCAMCDDAYGCAPISGGPCVCCSNGQSIDECTPSGNDTHPLPFCPAGGATGEGCIRLLRGKENPGTERDVAEVGGLDSRKVGFEEECGDGYTCVFEGAYGCAPINAKNQSMVCCSAGQPEKDCAQASKTSTPLPYCPAGGATGSGCVREAVRNIGDIDHHKNRQGKKQVAAHVY